MIYPAKTLQIINQRFTQNILGIMVLNKKILIYAAFIAVALIVITVLVVFWQQFLHILSSFVIQERYSSIGEYIREYGVLGMFIIIALQMFQVIITVLPSEPVQLAAGICYGTFGGSLLCLTGVIIGNQIMYLFIRNMHYIFTSKKRRRQQEELKRKIEGSNRNLIWMFMLLYITPAIPFGLICIIICSTGLKWWKYTLLTSLCPIIPITFSVFAGSAVVSSSPQGSAIMMIVIVVIVITVLFNRHRMVALLFRPKRRDYEKRLREKPVKKVNPLVFALVLPFFNRISRKNKVNYIYNVDPDTMKAPFVLLSNHASRFDHVYITSALPKHKLHFVSMHMAFYEKYNRKLLRMVGAIPKMLFHPDSCAVREMLKLSRGGGNIMMFPEGVRSAGGHDMPVNYAIVKLLKRLNVPVYSVKLDGAYLTRPKFTWVSRPGRIDLTLDKLFDAGEIRDLDQDELYSRIVSSIRYNDFEWNRTKNIEYETSDTTDGLNGLLYHCPKCRADNHMESGGGKISCSVCGNGATMTKDYRLIPNTDRDVIPPDIGSWFDLQHNAAQAAIDTSFTMTSRVTYKTLHPCGLGYLPMGEGLLTLSRYGLRYTGSSGMDEVDLHMDIADLPTVTFGNNIDIEYYYGYKLYNFVPADLTECSKWSVYVEEMHKLVRDGKLLGE